MKTFNSILALFFLLMTIGCSKDDNEIQVPPKSDAKAITGFSFQANNNAALEATINATIDETTKSIAASLPSGTDVTALTPTLSISPKAEVGPSGPQDFSDPVTYTVTAEDGTTVSYLVSAVVSQSSEGQLLSFSLLKVNNGINENLVGAIDAETDSVRLITGASTDLIALLPSLAVSEGASYTPQGVQDFTEPVVYTVTAADGTEREYVINIRTERDLLIALAEANPMNTMEWDFNETNIEDWSGVGVDDDGYVEYLEFDEDISVVPEEIGFFRKLRVLYLNDQDGKIKVLPKSIGLLSNLVELDLSGNELTALPEEFGQLKSLNYLDMGENLFDTFPEILFQLSNLIQFYISDNLLTELPSGFIQMTGLEDLSLSRNQFEKFPETILQLQNLTYLKIIGNRLKELPQEIVQLQNLNYLNVEDNLLTSLPDDMQAMSQLASIRLSNNRFEEIPRVLFFLESLGTLELNDNLITDVQAEIGISPRLRRLYLNNNLLTDLPKELATELNLEILAIRGNSIEVVPEEICSRQATITYFNLRKDETAICK